MKIAICTPHHSQVTASYAGALFGMTMKTRECMFEFNGAPARAELELMLRSGSLLPMTRSLLVEDAVEWGADYLLWVDSDQWFPDNALLRLLSWNLPVIGTNYARRIRPTGPTAQGLDGAPVYTTEVAARNNEVAEVASLGLGFCLVDMNVIRAIREVRPNGKPTRLFSIDLVDDSTDFVGEDIYFFRKVREAGYAVHLDHGLSWQIGHVHNEMLYNSDTLADRTAFLAG